MSEGYTPSMADLREAYVLSRTRDGLRTEGVIAAARADANRAIAAHDAEVVARETWPEPSVESIATALRHSFDWGGEVILTDVVEAVLSCRHRSIRQHDAELREQIAQEIEAHAENSGVAAFGSYGPPAIALSDALSIARGEEQD